MDGFLNRWTAVFLAVCLVLGAGGASGSRAQDARTPGVKANLDLPFEAAGEEADEEEAPEVVVFYGQAFEGTGFIFCCDKMC